MTLCLIWHSLTGPVRGFCHFSHNQSPDPAFVASQISHTHSLVTSDKIGHRSPNIWCMLDNYPPIFPSFLLASILHSSIPTHSKVSYTEKIRLCPTCYSIWHPDATCWGTAWIINVKEEPWQFQSKNHCACYRASASSVMNGPYLSIYTSWSAGPRVGL